MDVNSRQSTAANAPSNLAPIATQSTVPLTPPRSPATTSTSTSAQPSQYQVKQRKKAQDIAPIWQPPDLGNVGCCITSTYGQTLQDESRVSAALDFLKMEDWMISTTAQQVRLALTTRTSPQERASSEDKLAHLAVIKDQIRRIQHGQARIHEKYLEDLYLTKYWAEARDVITRVMFWDPKDASNYKGVMARLAELEGLADALERSLWRTSNRNRLSEEVRHAVHQKWVLFDEIINGFHKEADTVRHSMNWSRIDRDIWRGDEKLQLIAKRAAKRETIEMLWVNFAVLTVASSSFMGVGFFYSSGATGTWRDPDFWFLLQSSAVQLCGLFITALSFKHASGYDWAAGAASIMFALIAPVLYMKAPSQYSMLSSAASGVFQALLMQQRSVRDLAIAP